MPFWKSSQPPPNDKSSFARWTIRSIISLGEHLNTGAREFVVFGVLYRLSEIPVKPQEGTMVYVGVDVLPGGQPGFHFWDGTQWVKL